MAIKMMPLKSYDFSQKTLNRKINAKSSSLQIFKMLRLIYFGELAMTE